MLRQNLLLFTLCPLLLVLLLGTAQESLLCTFLSGIYRHWWHPPWSSSRLTSSTSQPFQYLRCSRTLNHLCWTLYIHVFLVMGSPELELVLSMWPHQCWVEGKDYLPQPTGNTPPKAAQDTISFLCSKDTLLAHIILYPFLLLGPRKILLKLFLITNILEKLNWKKIYVKTKLICSKT